MNARRFLPAQVPPPVTGRTIVVGAGKCAAAMAAVFEQCFTGDLSGLVVVPDGHAVALPESTARIDILQAAHPVPDARSVTASLQVLERVSNLNRNDQVICLLSGGGSALLCLPPPDVTLAEKQELSSALLVSGATIAEINCIRKHVSGIKGGRLAAAVYPAQCLTLAVSDVPGDDPTLIASGPTVADPGNRHDALAILDKYQLHGHQAVRRWLQDSRSESPKLADPRLQRSEFRCVARPADALAAATRQADKWGIDTVNLGDDLQGDALNLAAQHARQVRECLASQARPQYARLLLSGGETTVQVRGQGRGGRNGQYLLGLLIALDRCPGVYALACDTDGIDGSGTNAGAIIVPDLLERAAGLGLDAREFLEQNNSFEFFAALDALVTTGPTLTNVNDFRAILLMAEAWAS